MCSVCVWECHFLFYCDSLITLLFYLINAYVCVCVCVLLLFCCMVWQLDRRNLNSILSIFFHFKSKTFYFITLVWLGRFEMRNDVYKWTIEEEKNRFNANNFLCSCAHNTHIFAMHFESFRRLARRLAQLKCSHSIHTHESKLRNKKFTMFSTELIYANKSYIFSSAILCAIFLTYLCELRKWKQCLRQNHSN